MPSPRRSSVELLTVGRRGFSIVVDGVPSFIAFDDHPVFAQAVPDQLRVIYRPAPSVLHWPELGVRLSLKKIRGEDDVQREG